MRRFYRWLVEPVQCSRGWPYLAIAAVAVLIIRAIVDVF